jgi:hypothetical protein
LEAEVVEIQRIGVKTEPEFPSRTKKNNKKVETKTKGSFQNQEQLGCMSISILRYQLKTDQTLKNFF